MAKDYAKFVPPKQRMSRKKSYRVEIIAAIFLVAVLGVLSAYFIHDKKSFMDNFSSFSARVSELVHHKRNILAKNAGQKSDSGQDTQTPPVQFDFYHELPTMQVVVDEADNDTTSPTAPVVHPVITAAQPALPAEEPTKATGESVLEKAAPEATGEPALEKAAPEATAEPAPQPAPTPETAEATPPPAKADVFNPDEISNLLAAQKTDVSSYVVQLGTFETQQGAKEMVSELSSAGFDAKVVKLKHAGQVIYGVQQGPYLTKELAIATKQRLQKRGITSIIRKAA